jgi:hypothetical protein
VAGIVVLMADQHVLSEIRVGKMLVSPKGSQISRARCERCSLLSGIYGWQRPLLSREAPGSALRCDTIETTWRQQATAGHPVGAGQYQAFEE